VAQYQWQQRLGREFSKFVKLSGKLWQWLSARKNFLLPICLELFVGLCTNFVKRA
jgi:hypothetical protein